MPRTPLTLICSSMAVFLILCCITCYGQPPRRPPLKQFDLNGDGKISVQEFPGPPSDFKSLDKNGDGFITVNEAGEDKWNGTPPGGKSPGHESPGGNPPGGKPPGGTRPALYKSDKNKDHKISPEEFPGDLREFKSLDKNGDGFITRQEAGILIWYGSPGW